MRLTAIMALALAATPASAQRVTQPVFVTLGTMAGPIPDPDRSQPANLLRAEGQDVLIDVGDGTAGQLARAGVNLGEIDAIFISHLHFDHTGGLFALLGMRYQVRIATPLTIYGPPGTSRLVAGLLSAMAPASEVGAGIAGSPRPAPETGVEVIEIGDGDDRSLGNIRVRTVRNSHYSYPDGSQDAARFQSLSFRFEMPGRSIVYTGDTGESAAVERLAQGVDLLVSEVIDADNVIGYLTRTMPNMPPQFRAALGHHMRQQHLTAEQAGAMARRAGVRRLVLTHVALYGGEPERLRAAAAAAFGGDVIVASDLDRF